MRVITDRYKINYEWLIPALIGSYWGGHYTPESIREAVRNSSVCFLAQHEGHHIGFARVVSDRVIFSSIMDVIVHPDFRGIGVGTELMRVAVDHSYVKKTICILDTKLDGFYMKHGFIRRSQVMQRDPG